MKFMYTDVAHGPALRRRFCLELALRWIAAGLLITLSVLMLNNPAQAAAAYVQGNSGTPGSASSVSVTLPSAQTAGNLNVVFVGWNQATASVLSITDTAGNTYLTAIGPTVNPAGATQLVFYAQNVAAGQNTLTVTFSSSVAYPDVRILEFSGISASNALDVAVAASGNGTALNSGPLTTTAANDLLVTSGYCEHTSTGVGAGYTEILSSQWNLVEDDVTTSAGTYSATASASSSGYWVTQQVAFRAANTGTDTTPPTAPGGLLATAVSNSQINLTWVASSDANGVTGYLIERCANTGCSNFAQVGSTNTNTYQDTGLNASANYTYRVRASDGAGNLSGYSNTASDTTFLPYPAYVQGNSGTPGSASSVSVTLPSAQTAGNLNVVFVGWNQATASVLSITDTAGNTYLTAIGPTVNPAGATQLAFYAQNIAAGQNTVTVTFSSSVAYPDVRILEFSGISASNALDVAVAANGNGAALNSGSLTTTAASDLLVASGYCEHSSNGVGTGYTEILTSQWNLVEDDVTTSAGTYSAIASASTAGYWVMQQIALRAVVANTTPPTVPGAVVASAATSTQINLEWAESTDSVGVGAYLLERCQGSGCTNFMPVAVATTNSYSDQGLTAATSYSYRLRARDPIGNVSAYSVTVNATTLANGASGNTTPPTTPLQVSVTALSGNQINLSWNAASDAVGVTGYYVEECQGTTCTNFTQVGTAANNSFGAAGLATGTAYTFRVRATDAAGNLSAYSIPVTAMTSSAGSACGP